MTDQKEFTPFVPTSPIARCWWGKNEGCFNLLSPREKSWQVYLYVEFEDKSKVCISQTWDYDDEPYLDSDSFPEEVIEVIADRLEYFWISTSRKEDRGKINWMRDNILEINLAWAKVQLPNAQQRLDTAARYLQSLLDSIESMEEELKETQHDQHP